MVAQNSRPIVRIKCRSGYDVGGINQSRAIVGQQNKSIQSSESIQQSLDKQVKAV